MIIGHCRSSVVPILSRSTMVDIEEELNFHRNYLNRCFNGMEEISLYLDLNKELLDEAPSEAVKFAE